VLVSGEVGLAKPDPAIFRLLAQRFGVDPADAVFVDDSPANVTAAREVGFDGIVFTDATALRRDLVARGLLGAGADADAT
jgi:2-haloacid dehalogenase